MPYIAVPFQDLTLGSVIEAKVVIDPQDINPTASSKTKRKILRGMHIRHPAIFVERLSPTQIQVAYLSTLGGLEVLPPSLMVQGVWYPVEPSADIGSWKALPSSETIDPTHQWVNVRQLHRVTVSAPDEVSASDKV
ncbi:hypothetical protein H0H81_002232 [Sphagnurus paluster]|uniref:Uncharacterized protein n=1 Tax=Sphagnurus paluster TaxID=117069 RepID=A0A9P7FVP3_9AGAR|nr:hypothetical protein H0H81_002232 [Sphagnurus paluster]